MNWKELLKSELDSTYTLIERMIDKVDTDKLNWKPSGENNWMTVGQLLKHLAEAGGSGFKGFITGDWGFPEEFDPKELKPEEMLPPAEKLASISSVEEAKSLLETDKKLAYKMLDEVSEERLDSEIAKAMWDDQEPLLGVRLLSMIDHLKLHKAQLFYYLKLQGKPVNTGDLWL